MVLYDWGLRDNDPIIHWLNWRCECCAFRTQWIRTDSPLNSFLITFNQTIFHEFVQSTWKGGGRGIHLSLQLRESHQATWFLVKKQEDVQQLWTGQKSKQFVHLSKHWVTILRNFNHDSALSSLCIWYLSTPVSHWTKKKLQCHCKRFIIQCWPRDPLVSGLLITLPWAVYKNEVDGKLEDEEPDESNHNNPE